uniref:Uncharacterized protein n=1 Tax=Anguilla anguilla TaxID=7936 RepID=A0A0E9XBL2_ANGAN
MVCPIYVHHWTIKMTWPFAVRINFTKVLTRMSPNQKHIKNSNFTPTPKQHISASFNSLPVTFIEKFITLIHCPCTI